MFGEVGFFFTSALQFWLLSRVLGKTTYRVQDFGNKF